MSSARAVRYLPEPGPWDRPPNPSDAGWVSREALDDLYGATGITTEDALRVIARCARRVLRGDPVPESDDLELQAAVRFFDTPGAWQFCADGLMVLALERCRSAGRSLAPLDLDRLRRINARAHIALERLDARISQ